MSEASASVEQFTVLESHTCNALNTAFQAERALRAALDKLIHSKVRLTREPTTQEYGSVFAGRNTSCEGPATWRGIRGSDLNRANLYSLEDECYPTFEAFIKAVEVEKDFFGLRGFIIFAIAGDPEEYRCRVNMVQIELI